MTPPPETRRFRKSERQEQILLELKFKPHVRVAELAAQFGVTTETIRRDMEALSGEGLLHRAHGGASAPHPGGYRDLDERRRERIGERERIGRFAASLVAPGTTLMIDAGATTIEFARSLAFRGTPVTVITNSCEVAMILGRGPAARILLAPGEYLALEGATIGAETCAFLARHNVDACFLGAAGLSEAGVTEAVEGFDAVKRAMMYQAAQRRFLIDGSKFGRTHLARVAAFDEIGSLITDCAPPAELSRRLDEGGAEVMVGNGGASSESSSSG